MRSYGEFMEAARDLSAHPVMKPMPKTAAVATVLGSMAASYGLRCILSGYQHAAIALWIIAAPLLTPFALRIVGRHRIRRRIKTLRNEARSQAGHADA